MDRFQVDFGRVWEIWAGSWQDFGKGLEAIREGAGGVSAKRSQSARPLGEGVLDLIGRAVRSVDVV